MRQQKIRRGIHKLAATVQEGNSAYSAQLNNIGGIEINSVKNFLMESLGRFYEFSEEAQQAAGAGAGAGRSRGRGAGWVSYQGVAKSRFAQLRPCVFVGELLLEMSDQTATTHDQYWTLCVAIVSATHDLALCDQNFARAHEDACCVDNCEG